MEPPQALSPPLIRIGVETPSSRPGTGDSQDGFRRPRMHRNNSFGGIFRLKPSDTRPSSMHKTLTWHQLIAIGIGSTIGAGVYVLIGTAARTRAGPALTLSFFIACIAAAMAALCYAELSSRCPSAGSAYAYAYACVGEVVAWLIGWALILEYTVGGAAVARGISPNMVVLFGGADNVPVWLARVTIPYTKISADPVAAIVVLGVTYLLCRGIEESVEVQRFMTCANCCVLLFVIVAGCWAGFKHDWPGYKLPGGYMPFGVNGVMGGAAMVFFSYIGFDSVASTAEEVKNPQRDLPLGIGLSLLACGGLYMAVAAVLVGMVPYNKMDLDTPMSKAFADMGMPWVMYLTAGGALAALSTTLLGSLLPQPRILMAMARDGLLPDWFARLHPKTRVPQNSTILTGVIAAAMAFSMDIDQLSGMVSVGTLLAFTTVAVSVLIIRYVPPTVVPLPPRPQSAAAVLITPEKTLNGFQSRNASAPLPLARKIPIPEGHAFTPPTSFMSPDVAFYVASCSSLTFMDEGVEVQPPPLLDPSIPTTPPEPDSDGESSGEVYAKCLSAEIEEAAILPVSSPAEEGESSTDPLLKHHLPDEHAMSEEAYKRRSWAVFGIITIVVGSVVSVTMAAASELSWPLRQAGGTGGAIVLLVGFVVLVFTKEDEGQHAFGHPDGFRCPKALVPTLPILSIVVNTYLMVNLGIPTWLRVGVWLLMGAIWYAGYGRHNSILHKTYPGGWVAGLRSRSWLDLSRSASWTGRLSRSASWLANINNANCNNTNSNNNKGDNNDGYKECPSNG